MSPHTQGDTGHVARCRSEEDILQGRFPLLPQDTAYGQGRTPKMNLRGERARSTSTSQEPWLDQGREAGNLLVLRAGGARLNTHSHQGEHPRRSDPAKHGQIPGDQPLPLWKVGTPVKDSSIIPL